MQQTSLLLTSTNESSLQHIAIVALAIGVLSAGCSICLGVGRATYTIFAETTLAHMTSNCIKATSSIRHSSAVIISPIVEVFATWAAHQACCLRMRPSTRAVLALAIAGTGCSWAQSALRRRALQRSAQANSLASVGVVLDNRSMLSSLGHAV